MGSKSKREYLLAIWDRYQRVGRQFKSKILDEFCSVCGYARKYAIGLLRRQPRPRPKRPGPRRRYDAPVFEPLKFIWLKSEQMCSKRLKAALPHWLPFYEQKHGTLPEPVRKKLLRISPATIDRPLKKTRARYPGKGLCGTRPGRLLKVQISVRTDNRDIDRPGFLEADSAVIASRHSSSFRGAGRTDGIDLLKSAGGAISELSSVMSWNAMDALA